MNWITKLGGDRGEFVVGCVHNETHPLESILDIGCSYGWGLAALTGEANELIGVDMDAAALQKAAIKYPHVHFIHQSASVLPLNANHFDVAILAEVIEHVGDENKQLVVDEAYRVLKPNGLLVFTCPYAGLFAWANPMDFKRRFSSIYGLYARISNYTPATPMRIGHKHLSSKEIERLFHDRFKIERVIYCGFLTPAFSWVLSVDSRLHVLPRKLHLAINLLRSWESGVACPKQLAFNIRLAARKMALTTPANAD